MLGHADVGITLSVYQSVLPDMQESTARVMDGCTLVARLGGYRCGGWAAPCGQAPQGEVHELRGVW